MSLEIEYQLLNEYKILVEGEVLFLGEKDSHKCRFCNNTNKKKFKKKAHAISNLMGNNSLFTYYECDDCNLFFGQKYENSFANYMLFYHTMLNVKGKEGNVKYKYGKEASNIESTQEKKYVKLIDDESAIKYDKENNIFSTRVPTYTPLYVFKTLVKIAFTILPEEEIKFFKDALKWLRKGTDVSSNYAMAMFFMFQSPLPDDTISCRLYKRKETSKERIPYMIFQICYSHFCFQIALPNCTEDKVFLNMLITMPELKSYFDELNIKKINKKLLDLRSNEKDKNAWHSLRFEAQYMLDEYPAISDSNLFYIIKCIKQRQLEIICQNTK